MEEKEPAPVDNEVELLESWSDSVILHGDCVLDGDGLNQVADAICRGTGQLFFPKMELGMTSQKQPCVAI